jgi:hypothetical protein
MPNQLSPEEKKARRAEVNRQNAKKSTGPKTEAGKAVSRLNGLTNGTRAAIIDFSAGPGLALVSGEDPSVYREMSAEYHRTIGPNNRLEVCIVQRIVDAQWRLLRNSKLQSLELETGLEEARLADHTGLPDTAAGTLDTVAANRSVIDEKYLKRLLQEQAMLLRVINMSYRELDQLRKCSPQPKPPVRRRIEYIGEPAAPIAESLAAMENEAPSPRTEPAAQAHDRSQPESVAPTKTDSPQIVENEATTTQTANDRSQPGPAFFPVFTRPAKPKTFAAGAQGARYVDLDPV